jgi:hypothetical protein
MKLCSESVNDGSDKKGTEKSLRHRAHRIDPVTLKGRPYVLPVKETFEPVHFKFDVL